MRRIQLAPSILTADFGRLAEEVRAAELGGADMLHIDIMDGQFVPPITFGPVVVEALRKATNLPFDLHLMVVQPERYFDQYADLVDTMSFHVEAGVHANRFVDSIHRLGKRAGICLNPSTPVAAIEELLPDVDQVMVMTINPGWGGQQMLPRQLDKVRRIRAMADSAGLAVEIEIDGGVKVDNLADCVAAGADNLVCGSSVYNPNSPVAENLAELRRIADRAAREA